MHLADAFIQSDLQCIHAIHFFISMRVPWELNPQPFALLTQCSATEPQELVTKKYEGPQSKRDVLAHGWPGFVHGLDVLLSFHPQSSNA